MEQLDYLWEYQKFDLELDKIEQELRKIPTRQRMVKVRNYLLEQQKQLEKMNTESASRYKRYQNAQGELEALNHRIEEDAKELEALEEMTLEELEDLRHEIIRQIEDIARRQKNLQTILEDVQQEQQKLKVMRGGISKAQKEFPELKQEYDAQAAVYDEDIKRLKTQRDEIGQKLEQKLIDRYKSIKQRRPTPMAKVESNQCCGCNMDIAALVLSRARASGQVIECENCGRILYLN